MENTQANSKIIKQITARQLDAILTENSFTIIDVRDAAAIQSQGSIPGAVNLPLERIQSEFDEVRQENPAVFSGKKPLLFCCTGGVMSYVAALKFREEGVSNVYNLEGGHAGWMKLKQSQNAA